jgi:hypothetical protein
MGLGGHNARANGGFEQKEELAHHITPPNWKTDDTYHTSRFLQERCSESCHWRTEHDPEQEVPWT